MSSSSSSSKAKSHAGMEIAKINGRAVLQPACNRVDNFNSGRQILRKSLSLPKTTISDSLPPPPPPPPPKVSQPISPKYKPSKLVLGRTNEPNSLNSIPEKPLTPKTPPPRLTTTSVLLRKSWETRSAIAGTNSDSLVVKPPGSIAAERREHASLIHAQRKMKINHYGRIVNLTGKSVHLDAYSTALAQEQRRCEFLTPNSDPIFVAYHDQEWGVPIHDDKMLFELLVLAGAQVGMDWTTLLKKRQDFRAAFADFDPEVIANFSERQIASISSGYGIDVRRVRGVVDNSNRILEIRKESGSLDRYLWSFVNNKPISTEYRSWRKVLVRTSKSESISKELVKKGFRFVGPTVIHSFMQAAGITNGHLLTCPRHHECVQIAAAQS